MTISNEQVLSQVGGSLQRTAAEIAANVTPSNYAYPEGDVRRYGAIANTDSTVAIQNALNVAQHSAAEVVYIPANYIVSSTLRITSSFIKLSGLGRGVSGLTCNSSGIGDVILVNKPGAEIFGVQIQDIAIICQAGLSSPPNGITFKDASECYVERCFCSNQLHGIKFNGVAIMRVLDFESGGVSATGIYFTISGTSVLNSNDMVWLQNLNLFNTSTAGILIGGPTNDVQIYASYCESAPWGVLITPDANTNMLADKIDLEGFTSWNNTGDSFNGTGLLAAKAPLNSSANWLQIRNVTVNRAKSFQNLTSSYHIQLLQNGNSHANTGYFNTQIRDGEFYSASTAVVFSDATVCSGDIRGNVTALNGYQTGAAIALRAGVGTSSATGNNVWGTEETGAWIPTDQSGAGLTFTNVQGLFVRKGTMVTATLQVTYPTTANGSNAIIGGLPFKVVSTPASMYGGPANMSTSSIVIGSLVSSNGTNITLYQMNGGAQITNAQMSANTLRMTLIYESE